jgi:hypothetical protein
MSPAIRVALDDTSPSVDRAEKTLLGHGEQDYLTAFVADLQQA